MYLQSVNSAYDTLCLIKHENKGQLQQIQKHTFESLVHIWMSFPEIGLCHTLEFVKFYFPTKTLYFIFGHSLTLAIR